MTQIEQFGPVRLSVQLRLLLAALGIGCAVPLMLAAWLRPSADGIGTHRQLGLPPCTFVFLFGTRCPSCGMTTAWAHAVRGEWVSAVGCNAGGALLAAVAMATAPWALISAGRGRPLVGLPSDRALAALGVAVIVVALVDWACRLAAG